MALSMTLLGGDALLGFVTQNFFYICNCYSILYLSVAIIHVVAPSITLLRSDALLRFEI
jgi:hypothetical protein